MIAITPEVREREALKGLGLVASMAAALVDRGVSELTTRLAAELGALAWTIGYERWTDGAEGTFSDAARNALRELQTANAEALNGVPGSQVSP